MLLSRFFGRRAARSGRPLFRRRFSVEDLEGRQLLSTLTVTNVNDSGPGSFRQAIISSNATKGSATNFIDFQVGSGGTQTIALQSALPTVTHTVAIDAATQPGPGPAPLIVLDGTNAGANVSGITFETSKSSLEGVAVVNFSGYGVVLDGGSAITIADDYIGVAPTGVPAGNGHSGIVLCNGTHGDTITGDAVSGNGGDGLYINSGANHNVVAGNLIGTSPSGTAALGNADDGIMITGGSNDNVIGGTTAAAQNVISANAFYGVHIMDGSDHNVIEGNDIGTNAAGMAPLGNAQSGVRISNGALGNTVGGTVAGAGNVLSGNQEEGVVIDYGANGNFVESNLIGTNAGGTAALGNGDDGILITFGSSGNVIGGTTAAAHNVISANAFYGVHVMDGSDHNVIEGNLIGTTASGTAALGNGEEGVLITCGSSNNVVGGATAGTGNTIMNNLAGGVEFGDAGTGNLVEGNVIDANGFGQTTAGLGDGVVLMCSPGSTVKNNTIAINRDWGIKLKNSRSSVVTGNTFLGNGLGDIET